MLAGGSLPQDAREEALRCLRLELTRKPLNVGALDAASAAHVCEANLGKEQLEALELQRLSDREAPGVGAGDADRLLHLVVALPPTCADFWVGGSGVGAASLMRRCSMSSSSKVCSSGTARLFAFSTSNAFRSSELFSLSSSKASWIDIFLLDELVLGGHTSTSLMCQGIRL